MSNSTCLPVLTVWWNSIHIGAGFGLNPVDNRFKILNLCLEKKHLNSIFRGRRIERKMQLHPLRIQNRHGDWNNCFIDNVGEMREDGQQVVIYTVEFTC